MKGKAHTIYREFVDSLVGAQASFIVSRLIILARISPDAITPELDDLEIEKRLQDAIAKIKLTMKGH